MMHINLSMTAAWDATVKELVVSSASFNFVTKIVIATAIFNVDIVKIPNVPATDNAATLQALSLELLTILIDVGEPRI